MILLAFAAGPPVNLTAKTTQTEKKQEKPKIKIVPERQIKTYKKKIISAPPKYTGEPGDFIFYNADLKNVLLFFAKQYKLNMVIDPGIEGKVTCRMIQIPWDQALDVILRQNGLAVLREGAVTHAAKLKNKK